MGCDQSNPEVPKPSHTQHEPPPQIYQRKMPPPDLQIDGIVVTNNSGSNSIEVNSPADMLAVAKKNNWETIVSFASQNPIQNLGQCWLEEKGLKKVPNFSVFKSLTILSLRFNSIDRIEIVNLMPQLKELYLNKNQIKKIENLQPLKKLTHLGLGANNITKIEGLKTLVNLQDLTLYDNQIEILQGLENNQKISNLLIYGNKIKGTPQQKKIIKAIVQRGGMVYLKSSEQQQQG